MLMIKNNQKKKKISREAFKFPYGSRKRISDQRVRSERKKLFYQITILDQKLIKLVIYCLTKKRRHVVMIFVLSGLHHLPLNIKNDEFETHFFGLYQPSINVLVENNEPSTPPSL